MTAVYLHVAVGANYEQARTLQVAGDVLQQVECAAVGPVQVLEHDNQGLHAGGVAQEGCNSLQEPPAVIVRVSSWTQLDAHAIAYLRHDAGNVGGTGPQV